MSRNGNDAICLDCHGPFFHLTGGPQVCKPCLAKETEKRRTPVRQTDLTLAELKNSLQMGLPKQCFYINEIGVILVAGGEDAALAEETLKELLSDKDQERKCLAFCWLSQNAADLSADTIRKIGKFKNDPANQETVQIAEELISESKSRS